MTQIVRSQYFQVSTSSIQGLLEAKHGGFVTIQVWHIQCLGTLEHLSANDRDVNKHIECSPMKREHHMIIEIEPTNRGILLMQIERVSIDIFTTYWRHCDHYPLPIS